MPASAGMACFSLARKAKTMSNKFDAKAYQSNTAKLVKDAIASSVNHFEKLKAAGIAAVTCAIHTDIANIQPLNDLFKGVSRPDASGLIAFISNVNIKFGGKNSEGKPVNLIGFKPSEGTFHRVESDKDDVAKLILAGRKAFTSADETTIAAIKWEKMARETEAGNVFNINSHVARFLKGLINAGYVELAKTVNRDVGTFGLTSDAFAEAVKNSDITTKLEKVEKQRNKLLAAQAAQANGNVTPQLVAANG